MSPTIKIALKIIWGIFFLYWTVSALTAKQPIRQEGFVTRFLSYWAPLIIAVLLLGPGEWFGHTFLREQFVPHSNRVGIIGIILCFSGAMLAIWSRYLLGRNWSLSIQLKQDHKLITAGPYGSIRHPIYTGLLLLFSGNALIVGDYRGVLAVLIVFISFWYKLRKEEEWLTANFGEAYIAYKKKTKALFPGIL